MLGELNASHSGISAPGNTAQAPAIGRLGVRFDRSEFENKGALRITEVIPLTPAAITNIKPGEYLISIDGSAIGARTNLDEMLAYKIGKRVVYRSLRLLTARRNVTSSSVRSTAQLSAIWFIASGSKTTGRTSPGSVTGASATFTWPTCPQVR